MTELLSLLVPASAPATASQPGTAAPVDAAAFTQALKQAMASSAPATTQVTANADETTSLPLPAPAAELAANVEAAPAAASAALPAVQPVVTAAVTGSDPGAPTSRSLDTLDPEFRTRLERVIGRVERELGYEVRVLETYRTPERQNALYEQGRTTAGPVVTWTRNSLHMEGRASDLQLVGAAKDPNAYARLGTIAAEEGLRTLGPRDPGHVELPLRAGESTQARVPFAAPGAPAEVLAADAADANQRIMAIAQSAGRTVPRAQDVATYVHEVARTALAAGRAAAPAPAQPVARLSRSAPAVTAAQPAAANVTGGVTPMRATDPQLVPQAVTAAAPALNAAAPRANMNAQAPAAEEPAPIEEGGAPRPAAAPRRAAGERVYGAERVPAPAAPVQAERGAQPAAKAASGAAPARERSTETTAPTPSVTPVEAAQPSPGQPAPVQSQEPATAPSVQPRANVQEAASPDMASRIERVVALQESLAAQPVHSVLLRLDQDDASLAQIRVGVRGSEVMAALNVADPRLADALRAEMPELQRALEKHGLDPSRSDGLRVLGGALAEGISTGRTQDTGTRGNSDTPYRQPQGGHRDPQQRSRGQQREQKEQP